MTEAEWLACTDPTPMLDFLQGKASDRKLRLFACACCRRIWPYLTEKRSRWLVEISERYADTRVTRDQLNSAWDRADFAWEAVHLSGGGDAEQLPAQAVLGLGVNLEVHEVVERTAETFGAVARGAAYERIWESPGNTPDARWLLDEAIRIRATVEEGCIQATLLRDICGNPFRSVGSDPGWLAWNNRTAQKLAQVLYEERVFDRLPILADALEEAGCSEGEMLGHLRSPGPHVRGCWAIDALLRKE